MDTKFGWRNLIKATMVILGIAVFAYSSAGDYFDFPSLGTWKTFGLIFASLIFLGAILWHFMELQAKLDDIENASPNVEPAGFKLEKPFYLFRGGKPDKVLNRYYLMFRNVKKSGRSISDTQPIHATISFYDLDCEPLTQFSHEKPFWLDSSGPPWERPTNHNIVIKASSEPEGICIVVREQGNNDLYVFSDESYITNVRSLEPFQESLKLTSKKLYICVQLNAANLDMRPVWVLLTNLGGKKDPIFELIDVPCNSYENTKIVYQAENKVRTRPAQTGKQKRGTSKKKVG